MGVLALELNLALLDFEVLHLELANGRTGQGRVSGGQAPDDGERDGKIFKHVNLIPTPSWLTHLMWLPFNG